MRTLLMAGAMALAFAGAAGAQTTMDHSQMGKGMNAPAGDAAAALPTRDYVAAAGASDQFEVQSGRMASSMAKSKAVKNFGQMMVTEHTKTTEIMKKTVMQKGMRAPTPMLTADQQAKLDALRGMSGADFDKAYLDQQMAAHQMALATHANYAAGGSDKDFRSVAAMAVPIVRGHLRNLTTLQAKANGAS